MARFLISRTPLLQLTKHSQRILDPRRYPLAMASMLTGNKFDPNEDIPDLSGKVTCHYHPQVSRLTRDQQYIVVGGTAGIGFGITAHILQHKPAKLYLLSKKPEHGDEALKELGKYGDVSIVEYMKCELEDLKQVNEVANELKKLERLDGVSAIP